MQLHLAYGIHRPGISFQPHLSALFPTMDHIFSSILPFVTSLWNIIPPASLPPILTNQLEFKFVSLLISVVDLDKFKYDKLTFSFIKWECFPF